MHELCKLIITANSWKLSKMYAKTMHIYLHFMQKLCKLCLVKSSSGTSCKINAMFRCILWSIEFFANVCESWFYGTCKNLCKFYANPNLYAFYASARDSLYSSFLAKKNFLLLLVVGHWQSDPHRSSLRDEDWLGFFRSSNEPLLGRPIPG